MKDILISLLLIVSGIILILYFYFYNRVCLIFMIGVLLIIPGLAGLFFRRRGPGKKGAKDKFDDMDETERGKLEMDTALGGG